MVVCNATIFLSLMNLITSARLSFVNSSFGNSGLDLCYVGFCVAVTDILSPLVFSLLVFLPLVNGRKNPIKDW